MKTPKNHSQDEGTSPSVSGEKNHPDTQSQNEKSLIRTDFEHPDTLRGSDDEEILKEETDYDISERIIAKIKRQIEKPTFKSKVEVARLAIRRFLEEKGINPKSKRKREKEYIKCSECRCEVELIEKGMWIRTKKSWRVICDGCLRMLIANEKERAIALTRQDCKSEKMKAHAYGIKLGQKAERERILEIIDKLMEINCYKNVEWKFYAGIYNEIKKEVLKDG